LAGELDLCGKFHLKIVGDGEPNAGHLSPSIERILVSVGCQ
jgi:hypothetical protein